VAWNGKARCHQSTGQSAATWGEAGGPECDHASSTNKAPWV